MSGRRHRGGRAITSSPLPPSPLRGGIEGGVGSHGAARRKNCEIEWRQQAMTQKTIRLTMAQALAKFLTRQMTVIDGQKLPIFGGVFAIFGHGNVAGMGEALYGVRDTLPTFRAHNEQGMAHA